MFQLQWNVSNVGSGLNRKLCLSGNFCDRENVEWFPNKQTLLYIRIFIADNIGFVV